ncbi:hypothetical protein BDA99DRAFT_514500 [Phascolomyces articulosus]|uniref:Uncharacterized protein n=1 Tax=Phascolomyces articulosus TaxID=60185 RepID=A0AAD5JXA3_9FUNG|nr:hypothetical protein BDA99DRAFT_514500 [Phascolomyces articulosus]
MHITPCLCFILSYKPRLYFTVLFLHTSFFIPFQLNIISAMFGFNDLLLLFLLINLIKADKYT